MENRLQLLLERYQYIEQELLKQEVYSDFDKMKEYSKEKSEMEETINLYKKMLQNEKDIEAAKEMQHDPELSSFATEEIENLKKDTEEIEERLTILLLPKDPNDDKNVIVEIRGAAGGDEANIFAGDLYRMYAKYAEHQEWKLEVINEEEGVSGGFSIIQFMLKGENVYSKLKYESGAHRVQRVPSTETAGRIHTSTSTVIVMPEADSVDVEVKESDIKTDVYRSTGAGGQSVNTTDSAVRMTHIPTGIIVTCQNERSQIKNKAKALELLKAKIYEQKIREQEESLGADRKNKIGTGDRSEKIRTYNYPQNRLTDHRINYTNMNLDRVMEGHLEELIESLITEDIRRKMEQND
ncbi:MAG: peptide chain release factor 1 [Bacilli bacterium]